MATRNPSMDAILMILPGFSALIIACAAACATRNTPLRLVSITASQSSSFKSTRKPSRLMPALFTRISAMPADDSASAKQSRTEAESVTSTSTHIALPPLSAIDWAVSSSFSRLRAARTTVAPASASVSANCRPRPEPAPVTRATRPSRLNRSAYVIVRAPSAWACTFPWR